MTTQPKQITVKVDASDCQKQPGDTVKHGDVLGQFANQPVAAPCDGVVEGVSFDSDDHTLIVVIQRTP